MQIMSDKNPLEVYEKASEIIAKRVGISLSNICCRMPLRSSADRANM